MSSTRTHRMLLSLVLALSTVLASSVPLHAQDTGQPDDSGEFDIPGLPTAPDTSDVPLGDQAQQVVDQTPQTGQFPTLPPAGAGLPSEPTIAQLREALEK